MRQVMERQDLHGLFRVVIKKTEKEVFMGDKKKLN